MTSDNPIVRMIRSLKALSDRSFLAVSIGLFVLVIIVMACLSMLFMGISDSTYDMGRFFAMAKVIVDGGMPYIDYQDPKPPLIFFTLTIPTLIGQELLGGMTMVAVCNLISALVVMKIGWKLYGRNAGLAAGLLFLGNIAWAQGYFVMTEPFTILFLVLATYFAMFSDKKRFVLSGLCVGIAICYKQYALIGAPLLIMALFHNKEASKIPAFLAGMAVSVAAVFGSIYIAYSAQVLNAALYWSFGIAFAYISRDATNPVIATGTDTLELVIDIAIAVAIAVTMYWGYKNFLVEQKHPTGETYFMASAIGFSLTLLIRQYLHYWALALPYLAILYAGWFFSGNRQPAPFQEPLPVTTAGSEMIMEAPAAILQQEALATSQR